MEKPSAVRPWPLLLIVFAIVGIVAVFFINSDLMANSDSLSLDRLFSDLGVVGVPPIEVPVGVNLKDINGRYVSLSDFKGKIVFLNFWTTWCPTCRIEMPSMEKLHQEFKDRDFAMVTINLQESASQVKAFFEKYKLTFTALLDSSGDVGVNFGITAIPTTYILDKTGRIIGRITGPREWDSKASIALFKKLINNDSMAAASEAAN